MSPFVIPRQLTKNEELVIIPKKEYEDFLALRRAFALVESTEREKRAIKRGRKEIKEGKYRILE